jgi:hypothetical protein
VSGPPQLAVRAARSLQFQVWPQPLEVKTSVRVQLETVFSDATKPAWPVFHGFHGNEGAVVVGVDREIAVDCDLEQ